ncbi:MAG TPA: hypothetical protein PLG78_03460, partial [Leptospiraceae bacterium]|nr:hypothetical protein [Leptospiraceae bacterium]
MRLFLNAAFLVLTLPLVASCRLAELQQQPPVTPSQWCELRPCVTLGTTVFNEPLGSFLVFLLAFLWVASGVYFLKNHDGQSSRKWL